MIVPNEWAPMDSDSKAFGARCSDFTNLFSVRNMFLTRFMLKSNNPKNGLKCQLRYKKVSDGEWTYTNTMKYDTEEGTMNGALVFEIDTPFIVKDMALEDYYDVEVKTNQEHEGLYIWGTGSAVEPFKGEPENDVTTLEPWHLKEQLW